ncbi:MAG: LemA family protein [Planctomycetaceae bacterium]|jgi:LemA protein|nr:LemA family protein [Planctomycetaceae bacterium]
MPNELDEMKPVVNPEGRDINVIERQLPVQVGFGSVLFEVILWVLGIFPGLIFLFMKIGAQNYLRQLQQKIQHDASQIDNYLEQRVIILQNAAGLVTKAVELDADVMKGIAALRSGTRVNEDNRSEIAGQLESIASGLKISVEQYPNLQAHAAIADAMQQNSYLQREITAAREVYNDAVMRWNQDIFAWPTKMIVAARAGYTTRIPFNASKEIKEKARSNFFG